MSKNQYPIKISPLTPEKLEALHGRAEEVLFWQGEFINESWHNCSFYHCRFEDVKFFGNLMQAMSFFSCILKNVSFERTGLSGIGFNCSVLEEVNFKGSDLNGLNFFQARLQNCNFTGCEMEGVNFDQAELIGCDFSKVDLRGVNLKAARSMQGCTYNHQTKLSLTNQEAQALGMIYLSTHLQIVSDLAPMQPTLAAVIPFPVKAPMRPVAAVREESVAIGQVINLVDYKQPKATGDDGPWIA
jgi:hypothetical protein